MQSNKIHFHDRSYPRHLALGFPLIEVLVAIVVLSFGLLGMVGMQAASLHANRASMAAIYGCCIGTRSDDSSATRLRA